MLLEDDGNDKVELNCEVDDMSDTDYVTSVVPSVVLSDAEDVVCVSSSEPTSNTMLSGQP